VPTSTEWRKEQLRAGLEVAAEQAGPAVIDAAPAPGPVYREPTSPEDFNDEGPVEGEIVE
jgi:hypothetical protein